MIYSPRCTESRMDIQPLERMSDPRELKPDLLRSICGRPGGCLSSLTDTDTPLVYQTFFRACCNPDTILRVGTKSNTPKSLQGAENLTHTFSIKRGDSIAHPRLRCIRSPLIRQQDCSTMIMIYVMRRHFMSELEGLIEHRYLCSI